jgi:hypothetical protein
MMRFLLLLVSNIIKLFLTAELKLLSFSIPISHACDLDLN